MEIRPEITYQNIFSVKLDKQKIALIIPGGIGTGHDNMGIPVLERLVKLLSNDFQVTVFSLFKINDDYQPIGFELISIPDGNVLLKGLKLLRHFYRIRRQERFDVVHGFWALPSGFFAVIIGKIFGLRSIVSILGGDAVSLPAIQYGQLRKWIPRMFVLWTLRHTDQGTALTHYLTDQLNHFGLQRAIRVIPWGVDIKQFSFYDKPLNSPVQFLHIANLIPVKDQATLLYAFKSISDQIFSTLTIIGEGPEEHKLKSLARTLALERKIKFLGLQSYEALPAFYHQADILLHTSLSEGQSEVVTEAMSCGTIVCGTRVGLMADLPHCCVTVGVGDFHSLASQVINLVKDQSRMKEIRRMAFEWASVHSMQWTVEKTKELYSKNGN